MNSKARIQLAALTLGHFTVDFYGGLLAPIWNPTLKNHIGTDLAWMVLLVSLFGLVVNVVQPLGSLLLPRRELPALLIVPPVLAGVMALLGLSHSAGVTVFIVVASAIAIALFHPEGMLASHAVSGRFERLGVPIFISGGFFGMSCGNLLAGWWAQHFGLYRFWLLFGVGVLAALAMVWLGLHRLTGHADETVVHSRQHNVPFSVLLVLGSLVAVSATIFVNILTSVMVDHFPAAKPQQWAGSALFLFGLAGALGSYLWGHLSQKWTCGGIIAVSQLLGILPLWALARAGTPQAAVMWSAACGLGMGATFPLVVILARNARGLSHRLRAALIMGGSWGIASILFGLAGRLLTHGGPAFLLKLCIPTMVLAAILGLLASRGEKRAI